MRSSIPRILVLVMGVVLGAAACTPQATEPETRVPATTSSTTTTTLPSTTTTTAQLLVQGAPPDLVAAVMSFYDYATGVSAVAPIAAEPIVASLTPGERATPSTGVASVATFKGQRVATVEMGADLFLAVHDGAGWRIVGGNWPSLSAGPYFGATPRLVAVIGSDARPGETITAKLADSIHLVGLDGAGGGGVVGIPRDSWVDSPAGGRRKITSVLVTSGPDALVDTLTGLTGLPLEGYVLTGFVGFQEMLGNILGGVNVTVPFAINDRAAEAYLAAGEQYLNGPNALAFARARKTVPNGDFTRSEHQGLIMIAAAKAVRSRGYASIPTLMELSEPWLATDLTAEQVLTFSALLIRSDLDAMVNVVAPGKPGTAGSASVVYLSPSVSELWADLADGRLEQP